MISQEMLNKMSQTDREMVQMFQLVFNQDELNLITSVFGLERLAVMMKLATVLNTSGRRAGLFLISAILQGLKDGGNIELFFAEANSFKPVVTSNSVN